VVILDGIDRLSPGVLSVLDRLIHDREIDLFDGGRLLRWDRYDKLFERFKKENPGLGVATERNFIKEKGTDPGGPNEICFFELIFFSSGVLRVSPQFRILALGLPPSPSGPGAWLEDHMASMFNFHVLPNENRDPTWVAQILENRFPDLIQKGDVIQRVLAVHNALIERNAAKYMGESEFSKGDLPSLSLRQIIRLCIHLDRFPNDIAPRLKNMLMYNFLSKIQRADLEEVLNSVGVNLNPKEDRSQASRTILKLKIEVLEDKNQVKIGELVLPRRNPQNPALVPKIFFFENEMHVRRLQDMFKAFALGEHILLIGNQGVGKNVLADKFLELLQCEREYCQLHRDTTVQSLTTIPTLKSGIISWQDSPLLLAVKHGRILVLDEADKAPLEVTVILKGLVEDGEMLLTDGRQILRQDLVPEKPGPNIIPIHPDFRMFVLANRPGFPFKGNNFFRECGDCFNSHVIDNPDHESFVTMLAGYGPNVDLKILNKLVDLFTDLRQLVDEGLYPLPTPGEPFFSLSSLKGSRL
jgi:hypothetical protein